MKLADEAAHHLATAAADFIDRLAEEYGEEADLTGFVLVAEVAPPDEDVAVRWESDASWAHAAGIAQAAANGLHESD